MCFPMLCISSVGFKDRQDSSVKIEPVISIVIDFVWVTTYELEHVWGVRLVPVILSQQSYQMLGLKGKDCILNKLRLTPDITIWNVVLSSLTMTCTCSKEELSEVSKYAEGRKGLDLNQEGFHNTWDFLLVTLITANKDENYNVEFRN